MSNPFQQNFQSLEEIVDLISVVTKCPVTLEDANHRLLAYSSHDEQTDPARTSTIIGRRVPEKVINSLWKEGVIPALINHDYPIRIKQIEEVGLKDRVAISIRKNEQILGYIWVLEAFQPLTDEHFTNLIEASQAAKNLLLKLNAKKNQKEESNQEVFRRLLSGYLTSAPDIKDTFERLGMMLAPSFAVLVFTFEDVIDDALEKQISYILATTQKIKMLFNKIDDQELIVLASPLTVKNEQNVANFVTTFLNQMAERFEIYQIRSAFSSIYTDYSKVQQGYQEALTTLKMKQLFPKELATIYSYEDLGIYQMIDLTDQHLFKSAALAKLIDYDKRHHSDLLSTLEIYLDHDSNVAEAAKALHIHVNTLNYRLKRITEISHIDTNSFNQKSFLYFCLKQWKYQSS